MRKKSTVPSWRKLSGISEVLPGEDKTAYNELCAKIDTAIAPVDIIDELSVADYRSDALDVLRLRGTKFSVQKAARTRAVKTFLRPRIDVAVEETVLTMLRMNMLEGADVDEGLAQFYADNPSEAIEALPEWLTSNNLALKELETKVRGATAWEFAKLYVRGDAWTVKWVNGLLEEAALTLEDVIVPEFETIMDLLDQLDRMIAAAKLRRNTTLRGIERRHATLGAALRRVQIEQGESKLIEATPSEEKVAA
jgi:hypothetical protein